MTLFAGHNGHMCTLFLASRFISCRSLLNVAMASVGSGLEMTFGIKERDAHKSFAGSTECCKYLDAKCKILCHPYIRRSFRHFQAIITPRL